MTWILVSYWSDQKKGTGIVGRGGPRSDHQVAGGRRSPLGRVGPVLHPNLLARGWAGSIGPRPRPPPPGRRRTANRCTPPRCPVSGPSLRATRWPGPPRSRPRPGRPRGATRRPGAPPRVPPPEPVANRSTPTPVRRSPRGPGGGWAQASPICSPSTRPSGVGSASTTVTVAPRPWQVAATSEPMNPAPITTTRAPAPAASRSERIAKQSSSVRRTCDVGHVLGARAAARARAPVATIRPS